MFDVDCLKRVERLEIEGDCFNKVTQFVIDGLNELKSMIIGKESFELDYNSGEGSRCVIMNCDQLSDIHFGYEAFSRYRFFELKNLPSLISIQFGYAVFSSCQSIIFDSINDE